MKSIDLTQTNGDTVTVFIEKMTYLRSNNSGTAVGFGSNEIQVQEKRTEILEKLKSPSTFFVI